MADPDADRAVEAALDELFAAPPDEFVLTRARLERQLRQAGHAEAGAEIKRLRRPGIAVWAVNRLAREDPDAIEELLDATERVRAAQHTMLQGGRADELREESRARQQLVDGLADEGVRVLVGHTPKPVTHRDDIASLLEAASLDPASVEDLRAGRLTRALPPAVGFDALGDAPVVAIAPRPSPAREPSRKEKQELAAAQRDADSARDRARAARQAVEDAEAEEASAGIVADTARSRIVDVERALAQAREEQRAAEGAAKVASERVAAARRAADEAAERLRRAEARLRNAGG